MKKVIISIKGLQGTDDEGNDIELVTDGTYSYQSDSVAFEYMESELTGMEGTRTEFMVEGDQVMITRRGTVNMQMSFKAGEKYYFAYDTPYGNMMMGVDTQSVLARLDERGGSLIVRYIMDFGSAMVTRNKFEIYIKEA